MESQFSYLDQDTFRPLYFSKEDPLRLKMYVEGIKCIKCIQKIESLKNKIPGLQSFEINMATQVLDFKLNGSDFKFADVADQLTQLGFQVVPLPIQELGQKHQEKENQNDLVRVGVAGFLAGNIMLFSFAIYFGLTGSIQVFFEWLQFALYLPFVTYVAWPFYKGFLSGIKNRQLSIDGPMAIASLLGFLASSYHLWKGEGSLYFDSLSGFLFLILVTRYFQKQARSEFLKYLKPSALVETLKARGLQGQWIRTDQLKKGDQIRVLKNEWIPVDGFLASSEVHVDTSILNGESHYKRVLEGQKIEGGSRLLSQQALVNVQSVGLDTTFGRILSHVKSARETNTTETAKISDQASQVLLITVLSIASILIVIGLLNPGMNYFERGLALIILACPCAMAFGTPLAMALVMKKAQQEGLLIKSFHALEEAQKIKTIYLDKTGTVTSQRWQVQAWSSLINEENAKSIILALESVSDHPVANALRSIWSDTIVQDYSLFKNISEIPSRGVRGNYNDQEWVFESELWQGKKFFVLKCDGVEQCRFRLESFIAPQALKTIQDLRKKNIKICLVSGDQKQEVMRVAEQLGIESQNCYFEMTAEQKRDLIEQDPDAMMVGDGANDSLALSESRLGVAVSGSVDLALRSADVLFLKNDLHLLSRIFTLSQVAKSQIRKNLMVALVYNLIGAGLAISGLATPFIAALLMPVSSLFILGFTWWGIQS